MKDTRGRKKRGFEHFPREQKAQGDTEEHGQRKENRESRRQLDRVLYSSVFPLLGLAHQSLFLVRLTFFF